jgi:hypothetical protein
MFYIQPRCENVKYRAEFFFGMGGGGGGGERKSQTFVSCEFRVHENRTACMIIAICVVEPYRPKTFDNNISAT